MPGSQTMRLSERLMRKVDEGESRQIEQVPPGERQRIIKMFAENGSP